MTKKCTFSKKQNFSSNCSPGLVWSSFDNSTWEILYTFWKTSHLLLKLIKKTISQEINFRQNVCMDTWKAVLTISVDKNLMKAKNFHLKSERKKTHVFWRKLLQIVLTDKENANLITPPVNFWLKFKKIPSQCVQNLLKKFNSFSSNWGSFKKYTFFRRRFYWRREK